MITKKKTRSSVDYDIYQHIKATMMCVESVAELIVDEELLITIDESRDNCGIMSPHAEAEDIMKANEKILLYISSISDKQRIITPNQLSKELGMSAAFIENILIANGFEEDY